MNSVYVLHHVRPEEDDYHEDVKMIGVFADTAAAEAAKTALLSQPGFRDYPDGFHIDEYELNQIHWQEGFGDPS